MCIKKGACPLLTLPERGWRQTILVLYPETEYLPATGKVYLTVLPDVATEDEPSANSGV